jgi:light-regulated signal transduction histidine kinase (bacteriophytochrome)
MQEMIKDLLELSRVNTQGKPFERVDLRSVAEEMVSDLEVSNAKANAWVEIDNLPRWKPTHRRWRGC